MAEKRRWSVLEKPRKTAVLVNDAKIQLNALAGHLRGEGVDVLSHDSAEAALAAMSPAAPPDLIVTDLHMPGIDGWRFRRLMRSPEYEAFNHIPILMVSAAFSGDEASRIGADLGVSAFLPSPVNRKRFIETARMLLGGERPSDRPRVLIIENNTFLSDHLKNVFENRGYRADAALTAREAAYAIGEATYDAAVIDFHLPDGRGDALLEGVQNIQPDCVCIMMTTDPEPGLALAWMRRGAAAHLRKPFDPDYLVELCAKARRERALLRVEDLLEERTRRLRESERRYAAVLDAAGDGIVAVDREGVITLLNPGAERLLGCTAEEAVGSPASRFCPEDLHAEQSRLIPRVLKEGVVRGLEAECLASGGRRVPVEITLNPLTDDQGAPAGVIAILRDITERGREEEKREKLQASLARARKMESVGRLAGGVVHDFNNMLTVILGRVEIARIRMDPSHELYPGLLEIKDAAERSKKLTRQLLAFVRKQIIAPFVLNLDEIVEGMLTMLRRLIGESIELVWRPSKDPWPVKVDPSQIDQILANLCVNAHDAITGVGEVRIETVNVSLDKSDCCENEGVVPGEYVRLTVSDNGCGMDKETLDNLYEPFFTTKETCKGTGLGLSTVYGIVKQNNGFINVCSEPGQGAAFKIHIPRHAAEAARMEKEAPAAPAAGGDETILLVEDAPAILKMLATMLEHFGYNVLAAARPDEAIRVAKEHHGEIHLLVTDVIMPGMNGKDLARSLASLRPNLECLYISGYAANEIAHNCVLDEGVRFMQKPFSGRELAAKVREALDA